MTEQETYEAIREFFSRPGAVLAREQGYIDSSGAVVLVDGDEDENSDYVCFYRHPDNPAIRCSLGCVIPDALYEVEMEQKSAFAVLECFPALKGVFPWASLDAGPTDSLPNMLDTFQGLHDSVARNAADFVQLMDLKAEELGLTVPV